MRDGVSRDPRVQEGGSLLLVAGGAGVVDVDHIRACHRCRVRRDGHARAGGPCHVQLPSMSGKPCSQMPLQSRYYTSASQTLS